jgi:heme exporter protein D
MQAIHQYLSTNDLWAMAAIAVVALILGLNCSYQKRRTLVRDRIDRRVARPAREEAQAGHGVGAHA